jgi:hypothetical protein
MGYVYTSRQCGSALVETLFVPCGDRHLNFCRYRHKHQIMSRVLVSQDCRGECTEQLVFYRDINLECDRIS